jgi:ABC-type glycerol-3-phosphate transport system substrate-binding protein
MRFKRLMSLLALLLICFTTQAQAKVTIEIWPVWADSAALLNDALKPFLAQNSDIEVNVSQVPAAQQRDKLIAAMAAGLAPDIVLISQCRAQRTTVLRKAGHSYGTLRCMTRSNAR